MQNGSNINWLLEAADAVNALTSGFFESVELEDGSRRRGSLPALITMLEEDLSEASPVEGGAKAWESKSPLHTPSLMCLRRIDKTARDIAVVVGAPTRGSTRDTLHGILGHLGAADDAIQRSVAADLAGLVNNARLVLGIDLPPIRLRSVRCPYCGRASILAARRESKAWCTTHGCLDPEERRYVWEGEVALRLLGESQAAG